MTTALDTGNTAWMLTATALVLFMTLPGLALFYGGLVRTKNVLSVLMQCFSITAWSRCSGWRSATRWCSPRGQPSPERPVIGGLGKAFLADRPARLAHGSIPETVFAMFQLTFAIITPALIIGAFAERVRFRAMLLFMALWSLLVYVPVAHWMWGGGWLQRMGALDFAGGIVVHVTAGVAGLVTASTSGKRKGYPHDADAPAQPHALGGGRGHAVDGVVRLQRRQRAGRERRRRAWRWPPRRSPPGPRRWSGSFVEWQRHGRRQRARDHHRRRGRSGHHHARARATWASAARWSSALAAGLLCFLGATTLKRRLGYDDSLDAFGVHGVGGLVGSILTGVFASVTLGGTRADRHRPPGRSAAARVRGDRWLVRRHDVGAA